MNYLDEIDKSEEMTSKAEEPVVQMDLQRTLNFFDRHYDPNASIENAMTWDEFESEMENRINRMFDEKDSATIARVS